MAAATYLLESARMISSTCIDYFQKFVAVLVISVGISLLVRYLKLRFGPRVEPSPKKAIVITGATSGIGLGVAKRFYKKGFTVFATYYNDKEAGFQELQELANKPQPCSIRDSPKVFLVHMDVRSRESIDEAAQQVEKLLDEHRLELFCLICNAGIATDCSFELTTSEAAINTINTNQTGTVLVSKRFLKRIISDKGRILLTSSGTFRLAIADLPVYASTKASVASFAASLNECLERYGASCRCVCPGDLIGKSNVMMPLIAFFENALNSLSPEEKLLYQTAINEASTTQRKYLRLVNEKSNGLVRSCTGRASNKLEPSLWRMCKMRLLSLFFGGFYHTKCELDETSAFEAYDDAVCVENAPVRLYPGNRFFQHITGPLQLDFYSPIVLENMYCLISGLLRGQKKSTRTHKSDKSD